MKSLRMLFLSSVSDTQTPQGILAVVKIPKYELSDMLCGENRHIY